MNRTGAGMTKIGTCLIAAGLLAGSIPAAPVQGGEAVDLQFFAVNEAGSVRGDALSPEFAENLAARPGGLTPTPVTGQAAAWSGLFRPRSRPLLVTVQATLGSRIELLALLVDTNGVVRLAARRPASTLFAARMDQGQPGSGEALVNAWRELAGDLHWAHQRLPAGAGGPPVRVSVKPLDAAGEAGDLTSASAWVVEAMALAGLALEGRPAVPAEPADLVIRASRRVVYDLSVEGPVRCLKRVIRQEDLFPALRMTLRKHLLWGVAVSDAHLLDPAWEPVAVAGISTSQVAIAVAGETNAFSAVDGRPCSLAAGLSATSVIPDSVKARVAVPTELPGSPLLMPLVFGGKTLLLTRSRQALYLDAKGSVAGEWLFPDRLHDVVPVCEGGVLKELVLIDAAGVVWTWQPGQEAPVRKIDLRIRPNGPLALAPQFIADWNNVPADADEGLGGVVEAGRMLLVGTTDGFLIHMPYPIRGVP